MEGQIDTSSKQTPSRRATGRWAKLSTVAAVAVLSLSASWLGADRGQAAGRTRLWNLTSETIKEFRLAPAGGTAFGANQCANDKDGTVDHDERLPILGVSAGRYDAKIVFASGRACFARNIEVKDGKVFTIDDHDLKDCK